MAPQEKQARGTLKSLSIGYSRLATYIVYNGPLGLTQICIHRDFFAQVRKQRCPHPYGTVIVAFGGFVVRM